MPELDQAKLNLVTNYFAEDWAIEKAMDLLVDYEKMIGEQQPVPSVASVASKAVLAAIRAANMQMVRTGDDEFMLVTLKKATPHADSVLEDAAQVEIDSFNDLNRTCGNTITAYAKELHRLGYRKTEAARKQGCKDG